MFRDESKQSYCGEKHFGAACQGNESNMGWMGNSLMLEALS